MKENFVRFGRMVDGWQPVELADGSGFSYVSDRGEIMRHRFKSVRNFNEGFAIVEELDGNITYVDKDEVVMNVKLDFAYPFYKGRGIGYIKANSYYVLPNGVCYDLSPVYECFMRTDNEKECVYKADNGNMYELAFKVLGPETDGMIPVAMKDGSGKTYFNTMTKTLLKNRCRELGRYEAGFADVITMMGDHLCIDTYGEAYDPQQVEFLRAKDELDFFLDAIERSLPDEIRKFLEEQEKGLNDKDDEQHNEK